ncbi:hypothetical protein CVT25_000713 [Psilocybe cyanescens]|uniref:Uncharacterized protein n=1 Tax=Psilocybe cyanescens TaxID=93625 RepID=A0A409XAZ2_PSICY|nr:hypothetical protein CVT25_000713 [Psilocybe cyanescens]
MSAVNVTVITYGNLQQLSIFYVNGSSQANPSTVASAPEISIEKICAEVNQSQKQGVHHPQNCVMAMVSSSGYAQVPNFSVPAIHNPNYYQQVFGNFGQSQPIPGPSAGLPSIGYLPAHDQYAQEHEQRAKMVYSTVGLNSAIGMVDILAISTYAASNKNEYEHILALKEGTQVQSDVLPADIIAHVKSVLSPSLVKIWNGFVFNFDSMVVQKEAMFMDLSNASVSSLLPYFDNCFMTIRAKDKVTVFKAPKKPTEFLLIIDAGQWEAAGHFLDIKYANEQAQSSTFCSSLTHQSSGQPVVPKLKSVAQVRKSESSVNKDNVSTHSVNSNKRKATEDLVSIDSDSGDISTITLFKTQFAMVASG